VVVQCTLQWRAVWAYNEKNWGGPRFFDVVIRGSTLLSYHSTIFTYGPISLSYFSMIQGKGWSQIRRHQKKCGPLPINSFSPVGDNWGSPFQPWVGSWRGGGDDHPGVSHTLCDVLCCVWAEREICEQCIRVDTGTHPLYGPKPPPHPFRAFICIYIYRKPLSIYTFCIFLLSFSLWPARYTV
jgi:hypothetical protein